MSCDQTLYVKLINILLEELENPQGQHQHTTSGETASNIRTYIQAVGAICRQAGHRFGDHVERVVPLVLKYARREDEELREQCLQACENMMYKCGKEITLHVPAITDICLDYICYDPNYNYDNDEDNSDLENDGMDCDDDEDEADESEDEYSDSSASSSSSSQSIPSFSRSELTVMTTKMRPMNQKMNILTTMT
jgi:cullin-associated NEDD8-dissociated protein 1